MSHQLRYDAQRTGGCSVTMVADAAPEDLRGTAYGFFNLVSGCAVLVASGVAGLLWNRFGAQFTFYAGATFAALAMMGLTFNIPRQFYKIA